MNPYTFPPGEISRSSYYLFQLQTRAVINNPGIEDTDGIYTSFVYYFGVQCTHISDEIYPPEDITGIIINICTFSPAPPQLISSNLDVHVIEGHNVTLSCEAIGQPAPTVVLLKHNTNVNQPPPRLDLVLSRETIISANREHDAGTYVCYARNIQVGPPLGKITTSALQEFQLYVDSK